MAFAVDLSGYYQNPKVKIGDTKSTYAAGFDISNIGNKIEYSSSTERDFLPINLKVGNSLTMNLDDYNSLCFAIDLNKLLVPTAIYAQNSAGNPITNPITGAQEVAYGQDPSSTSVPAGIFGSFTDMPGGIKEQLKEIDYAFGMEYWYDKQFAVRAGYFYEDATFGNRRFFTLGTGLKYNVFALDFSYLIPTDQRNPLQNTLCFTLFFNFDALKSGSEEAEKKD